MLLHGRNTKEQMEAVKRMTKESVFIAVFITVIIAIFIEDVKKLREFIKYVKLNNRIEKEKDLMRVYIKGLCETSKNRKISKDRFVNLVFEGYLTYIVKMAQTLSGVEVHYELEDNHIDMYFIDGLTSESHKDKIRELVKSEISLSLSYESEYRLLLSKENCEFDKHLDMIVEYIEDSTNIQMACADIVLRDLSGS